MTDPEEFTGGPLVVGEGDHPEDEPTTTDDDPQERDYEAEAREKGWVPKDKWRGDPDEWTDARTFIEIGQLTPAELRSEIRKLSRRFEEQDRKHSSTIAEIREFMSKTEQRAYDKALREVQAQMKSAMRDGDEAAFDAAQREMERLNKEARETAKPAEQDGQQVHPEMREWMDQNPWYGDDSRMTVYANGIAEVEKAKGLTGKALLKAVRKAVEEEFPDRFSKQPAQRRPSAVEGTASNGSVRGKQAGGKASQLPPDARAQGKKFVEEGLFKNLDEYAEQYFG